MTVETKPLAVRVLRASGWVGLVLGALLAVPSLALGAILGFDELARVWFFLGVIGVVLILVGVSALGGARPSRGGLTSALVACTLMALFLPGVGWLVTMALVIIASQTWPQLRAYYGLERRASA